jgi:hypothetical protein
MQERYGHFYERKNKEFRSLSGAKKKHVVPNTKAAQAYLAIVRQKPSTAYGFLGKIWSDFYNEVFGNATVTDMLFSYKIYDFCHQQAKRARKELSVTRVSSEVAVYGVFHLARICGFLLANDKWGKKNQEQVDQLITKISNDLSLLNSTYAEAKKILIEIRENHQSEFPNPTLYFKASVVQRDIAKEIAKLKEDD